MKPHRTKEKTTKKTPFFLKVFLFVFICAISVGILQQLLRYEQVMEEQATVLAAIETEKQKQISFENKQEYYRSDTYIEQIAREQLGMVKPDEILYINRSE